MQQLELSDRGLKPLWATIRNLSKHRNKSQPLIYEAVSLHDSRKSAAALNRQFMKYPKASDRRHRNICRHLGAQTEFTAEEVLLALKSSMVMVMINNIGPIGADYLANPSTSEC